MNNHFDVAIIGGGASGLFCACILMRNNPLLNVAIIEKQSNVGKKLLATGNGRCNLTNVNADESMYHGSFNQNINDLLKLCSPDMIISLFNELGLLTTVDSEGRVYPLSRQSNSVLDILEMYCKKHNVQFFTDSKVTDIKKSKDYYTVLAADTLSLKATNIVIATGSRATPETGADDSIFDVLKKSGHTITALHPTLSPVKVNSKILKILKGVRAQGEVSISVNNKILKTDRGEIQFTDKTLSGICVFNLSRIANTVQNSEIIISLLPDMNFYEITELLKTKKSITDKNETAEKLLIGLFNRKICYALLTDAGIDTKKTINELTDKELNKIALLINNWRFKVIPSDDFTRAQVVAGGVDGSEINPATMESKINKNMYIIGEAVDIDGDCGGLNLQFAFSSAYCAALELTK